ncbi:hypothetical protein HMPREF9195_00707 [Treponema medium ATCC 700293]|uniref:Uncharacterized protein n=2 Tax=Treponema medium TaxID=58231 RepID=A0AA87TGZ9_TREMD|nr:hypothetical protein [Treponema medium]EPF29421.1 hypothetical protein HMPREF9195_00707 [Treponema medium ATCC 700293]
MPTVYCVAALAQYIHFFYYIIMTAVLVYFDKGQTAQTNLFLEALKEGAHTRCDDLRILDGYALNDTDRLNMYGYIAVFCAEKPLFASKPDPTVITILKDHGLKEGCKGCVLTVSRGLFSDKFTRNVMNALESCGFMIDYFDSLRTAADARRAGANIG